MRERGEELGRRVRMQKTDVSFDVIYFFKKNIISVYIYIFLKGTNYIKAFFFF